MTIDRRNFLKSAFAFGSSAVTWGAFPGLAKAVAAGNSTKVLFLNLNGGLDGLAALQPSSGSLYSTLASIRPTLALNPSSLLALNGEYGFHPLLTTFKSLYNEGAMLPILGVGYEHMTRSHLDAEVAFARGVPDRLAPVSGGFLNRLGSYYGWNSLRAVSVSGTDLAFEGGPYRGLQVDNLESLYFRTFSSNSEIKDMTARAYAINQDQSLDDQKPFLKSSSQNFALAVDTTDIVHAAALSANPQFAYPNNQFGKALKDIHVLFSSPEINTQIGYMRPSGFDTHSTQQNRLDSLMTQFNQALGVYVQNMKALGLWSNLIIMIYSEFGRTNKENGSFGTDHGGANPVFLSGGAVQGGQLIGSIPNSELTDFGWLQMHYNVVEIYRRILMRLDLDPDAVFSSAAGPSLAGIFT
jgi:uncharacterized protein (DUF1501 family)